MNVMLFVPPIFHYSMGGFNFHMLPTLGLPYICAILHRAGHYAETIDLEALMVHPKQFGEQFLRQKESWPDWVGFTALMVSAQGVEECIAELKRVGYTGKIAVGGVQAVVEPERFIRAGADLVVVGECEGNIVELLETNASGVHHGKALPVDELPIPDFTHFAPDITGYHGNTGLLLPNPGISMWARGCPFSCIFCANTVFGGQKIRYRPAKVIIEEMRGLANRGCKHIYVYDDELVPIMPNAPAGWLKEIADGIEHLPIDWITQGRCSAKYITREMMHDVKRAGCKAIFWGIESFSEKVLKAVKKNTTQADIWHTLEVSKEAGIANGAFTMIGNYQETEEDLAITCEALGKAYKAGLIDYRQTTVCTAMPGTELENIQKREGWYTPAPNGGRQMLQVFTPTPWLTVDQIVYWQRKFEEACPPPIPQ